MIIFSRDLGISLGTSNVVIYAAGKGIVLREPSVVAMDKNTGKVLQVGEAAKSMLGRTPANVVAIHPLKDGAISDYEMTAKMLTAFLNKVVHYAVVKPRVIISVPSAITEVEERAVIQAAMEAGARRVYLIEAPLAAALGAQLDISTANGKMVVDIGGGTTDVGVATYNNIASSNSIKVGGDAFAEAIIRYVRKKQGAVIGMNTAEAIYNAIGCVYPRAEEAYMEIKGRDIHTGLPKEFVLRSSDVMEALKRPVRLICEAILDVLEHTAPELVADIAVNGIVLTGGGSKIYGMDRLIQERTEIPCVRADNPDSCVAYGCGKSLSQMYKMQEGTINLARKKLLKD